MTGSGDRPAAAPLRAVDPLERELRRMAVLHRRSLLRQRRPAVGRRPLRRRVLHG